MECRCDANPDNLDAGGAISRSHIKTEVLIDNWDPNALWTDFGIRTDIVVSLSFSISFTTNQPIFAAFYP